MKYINVQNVKNIIQIIKLFKIEIVVIRMPTLFVIFATKLLNFNKLMKNISNNVRKKNKLNANNVVQFFQKKTIMNI